MTDATAGVPPKKRTLFKRAAWQDAAKKEGEDIFSHTNEFKDIVAEENRRKEQERKDQAAAKRKAEGEQKRERAEREEKKGKRRKVSTDRDESPLFQSGSIDSERMSGSESKARSGTPLSLMASALPPNSLSARYTTLTRSASSRESKAQPVIVDLGDSDDDDASDYKSKSHIDTSDMPYGADLKHDMAMRPSKAVLIDDDGLEEVQDPEIAAIEARARARAAVKKAAAESGSKAPIAQLLIASDLPDTAPLMVKVRIDSTVQKPREAWCARQKFTPEMTKNVFFTWRGTRLYDSTTIKRLGIKVDDHGNVSIEGDEANIYDETNLPKVHVEAWTDETLAQHKKELAAEAEAARKAAEPAPVVEEREPTPEPSAAARTYRLFMKAKGMEDVKIMARPDTTFEKLANAFRTKRNIPKTQPLTFMFDGDRLSPMDTVGDTELEDMDSIDVLLK